MNFNKDEIKVRSCERTLTREKFIATDRRWPFSVSFGFVIKVSKLIIWSCQMSCKWLTLSSPISSLPRNYLLFAQWIMKFKFRLTCKICLAMLNSRASCKANWCKCDQFSSLIRWSNIIMNFYSDVKGLKFQWHTKMISHLLWKQWNCQNRLSCIKFYFKKVVEGLKNLECNKSQF